MKALITGGNGFIGSHLADRLTQDGWDAWILDPRPRAFDNGLLNVKHIQASLDDTFPAGEYLAKGDVVFHLAWTTLIESATRDPISDIQSNLIPFLRLLNACRETHIRKIIFVSSGGTIYGPSSKLPISESHTLDPINAYGVSKLAAEKYLQMYGALYGLDYTILRPSSTYGPRQNPKGNQGAVTVFLYRVSHGLPVTIWGDGRAVRDYVYISDLVDALVSSAKYQSNNHHIYNIGGTEDVSLIDLLERVEKTVNKQAIVEYRPSRKVDAPEIKLDTRLANRELGWRPRVLLSDGLSQTWSWMSSLVS